MKPEFERIFAQPTASVVEAGKIVGLARNASYGAAKRGEIPTLRFGGRLRVPTAKLRQMIEGMQTVPTIVRQGSTRNTR
jgi:hypothetical protein